MIRNLVVTTWTLCLLGCGGEERTMADWPSAQERTMQAGHAPTPFTAAQIREGCPVGRTVSFRIEMPGREPFLQVMRFVSADENGATTEVSVTDLEGKALAPPMTREGTWEEFQHEASSPLDATTIEATTFETELGTFDGWRYVVTATEEDGATSVRALLFARALPGPPVSIDNHRDGKLAVKMRMVRNEPGGAP